MYLFQCMGEATIIKPQDKNRTKIKIYFNKNFIQYILFIFFTLQTHPKSPNFMFSLYLSLYLSEVKTNKKTKKSTQINFLLC